jgi:ABC-type Fe3+/spermidine/putrescine transport system ATPase subunit
MAISDRIAVMKGGQIVQMDRPERIYREPATAFVADFLGLANLFPGTRSGDQFVLAGGRQVSASHGAAGATRMMIRPEAVRVVRKPTGTEPNLWEGRVTDRTFYGAVARLAVACGDHRVVVDVHDPTEQDVAGVGEPIYIQLPPERVLLLPE